jgi:hypothetical protein
MPFDEDEVLPSNQSKKIGIKKVSEQKSIFESMPKKPTPAEFEKKVQQVVEKDSSSQKKAAEFILQYKKTMEDKTLPQNKNQFQKDVELDLLRGMVTLAQEANNDGRENEGEGSLICIVALLKNSFTQRDKINNLEYSLSQITKQIAALDKSSKSG